MQVARDAKGGHALVALSVDSAITAEVLEEIKRAMDAESVCSIDLTE
jgi:D-3-phosphoglycerate dehydrogenase